MTKLLDLVADKLKEITTQDEIMAMDYMAYCGINDSEAHEYADAFLEECYHLINPQADLYDADNGLYEPNDADEIPMATRKISGNSIWYSYNGQTIQKILK